MRNLRLIALWFATVLLFGLYGWSSAETPEVYKPDGPFYTNLRFEPAVGFAAVGVGSASCLLIGILVIGEVRSRRLARGWSIVVLVESLVLATILPAAVVWVIQLGTRPVWREPIMESLKSVHLFQGEGGWWLFIAPTYAFWIALFTFATFIVCVFSVKRCEV
jgi:hypothetical protein